MCRCDALSVLLKEYLGGDEECAIGFKEAGDALVDFITRGEKFNWHEAFLRPIGYVYRHYLELECKFWIQELDKAQSGLAEDSRKTHDLCRLWQILRPLTEPFCASQEDRQALSETERVVLTFAKYDPKGQDFRYTRDSSGACTLNRLPPQVDVNQIRTMVGKVSAFFDGLGGVISQ